MIFVIIFGDDQCILKIDLKLKSEKYLLRLRRVLSPEVLSRGWIPPGLAINACLLWRRVPY